MKIAPIFLTIMSPSCLSSLFAAFAQHLQSAAFRDLALHRDHPGAFRRRRKLPLPCLIAVMLNGYAQERSG